MNRKSNPQEAEFARYWARELGTTEKTLVRLKGGINNNVYRCGDDQKYWIIKRYNQSQNSKHDRMQAEVEFLNYAREAVPGTTPEIIDIDHNYRCVVLEHLEGTHFPEGLTPTEDAVKQALDFWEKLNSAVHNTKNKIKMEAAEGFLSLYEHIKNIKERLQKMEITNLSEETKLKAKYILKRLDSEYERVLDSTSEIVEKGLIADEISSQERMISPGDFGFHNAIETKTGIVFIDFEFAGWDDPAKTILDFTLQPKVPTGLNAETIIQSLGKNYSKEIKYRCKVLRPILRLKWYCIILGVLQPRRLREIAKAAPERKVNQLIESRLRNIEYLLEMQND